MRGWIWDKRIVVTLLIVVGLTACSQDDLTKAAKASNELSHDLILAEQGIAAAYSAGKISLDAKDRYAHALKVIATNGQRFNDSLIELNARYPEGTPVPPDTLAFIRQNWATVSGSFAALLKELDLFGLGDAVASLKGHVNTIDKVVAK